MSESPTPWRSGLAAGLSSAAILWLIVSFIDATAAGFGALPAGLVAALFFMIAVGIASKALVVGVQRTATGVALLRLVVVALVPLCAFLAVPAYRVTRHVARIVPRVGPMPGIVLLVVGG